MTPSAFVIEADVTPEAAARVTEQQNIGPLPVIERGALLRVLTDGDIVVRAMALGPDPRGTTGDELMSGRTCEIRADESIVRAVDTMAGARVR